MSRNDPHRDEPGRGSSAIEPWRGDGPDNGTIVTDSSWRDADRRPPGPRIADPILLLVLALFAVAACAILVWLTLRFRPPPAPYRVASDAEFMILTPEPMDPARRYPVVLALHPGADADAMIDMWKPLVASQQWVVMASRVSKNGLDMFEMGADLERGLREREQEWSLDLDRVMAHGISGGGMVSHFLAYRYPEMFKVIMVNTCMINDHFQQDPQLASYPRDKLAIFLASPPDFRYQHMKQNRQFLEGLGWKIHWFEFPGGHQPAPPETLASAAMLAAQLIEEVAGRRPTLDTPTPVTLPAEAPPPGNATGG